MAGMKRFSCINFHESKDVVAISILMQDKQPHEQNRCGKPDPLNASQMTDVNTNR
jgi:hypothetical protein